MDEHVRVRWSNEAVKCFLETCLDEVNRVGRSGSSLKKESWVVLATKMDQVCAMKLTQKQLKNHYDYLKGKFSGWQYLKNKTGNLYNPETNTFNLSNQEWDDFFKGHPKAKTLRASPLLFPELCVSLFDGMAPRGGRLYAPSSTRERTRVASSSSSFTSLVNVLDLGDDEHDAEAFPDDSETIPNPADGSQTMPNLGSQSVPNASTSRLPKKAKATVDYVELADTMTSAINKLVSQTERGGLAECVSRLNTLGLEPRDRVYLAAFDLFGHSMMLRETWLMMPDDSDVLKDWIVRTGRRLGFLE